MKLINSIIKFYKDNEYSNKNQFMNYAHPSQIKSLINKLNPNYSEYKQINENDDNNIIGELFPYINEPKKLIRFVNSNYIIYNVKIPYSICKSDLYIIGDLYKGLFYSNILLIHNNNILDNDESNIEDISDGDSVIIIEDRNYPDKSYYDSLQKKYENEKDIKVNVVFDGRPWWPKKNFVLSEQITISEMINTIYLFYGYDYRNLRLWFNGQLIKPEEINIYEFFNHSLVNIKGSISENDRIFTECRLIGKLISSKLLIDDKVYEVKVGRLNNTKVLFCTDMDHGFGGYKKKMKDLYNICVNNIEIKYEDNQSFYSLGIKEDFSCVLKKK